jgi:hypothetical protein
MELKQNPDGCAGSVGHATAISDPLHYGLPNKRIYNSFGGENLFQSSDNYPPPLSC